MLLHDKKNGKIMESSLSSSATVTSLPTATIDRTALCYASGGNAIQSQKKISEN